MEEYLSRLASARPTPGGGSAAMVVAAAACALVAMAARVSKDNGLAERADELRAQALVHSDRDEKAFERVMEARGDARQAALVEAAAVPLDGMRLALQAMRLCEEALRLGNVNLVSDVGCAAEFAHAALGGCAYNVRINHRFIRDRAIVSQQHAELQAVEQDAEELLRSLRAGVNAALLS